VVMAVLVAYSRLRHSHWFYSVEAKSVRSTDFASTL
jgi:hypothetical protein